MPFDVPAASSPDHLDAFMVHAPYVADGYAVGIAGGPLSGLTLGVKDLFDVAGLKTGAGSPEKLGSAQPSETNAPVVETLLNAGCTFVGKTLTDELAFSLNGENAHYGTPVNPAAPGRIPGGSSAGSAVAVAGGLIDIGLGSDTGGSVRLPASYCGIWGLRPTHGRIDIGGTAPLAPSFDTVGWFARSPDLLARVGDVLFGDAKPVPITQLILATDMFDRVGEHMRPALLAKVRAVADRLGLKLDSRPLAGGDKVLGDLEAWRLTFRVCQSAEAWQAHGAWIESEKPALGPGIKDRFAYGQSLGEAEVSQAKEQREKISAFLAENIPQGTVIIVPGAVSPAPLRGLQGPQLDDIRNRALDILAPSGLGRLPQLALPALKTPDGPVGLGLIAAQGADELLLNLATQLDGL